MTPYEAAIRRTFEMTETTASEWVAVPVTSMTEVDDGKGGVTLPVFAFPQGYTPATTPFSHQQDCCHLCGHDIKNAYHIQHDARKLTMVVGSDCVTHFGEGLTGAAQAKSDIRQATRDLVNELAGLMLMLEEKGTYERDLRFCTGVRTQRTWAIHTDEGRACRHAHGLLAHVLFHQRGTVRPLFGKEASDRVLANWFRNAQPGTIRDARRIAHKALGWKEIDPSVLSQVQAVNAPQLPSEPVPCES